MAQRTSVYAGVWRGLKRVMKEAEWPAAPVPNIKPFEVKLCRYNDRGAQVAPMESLLVVTAMWNGSNGDSQEAVTTEYGYDETFFTELIVSTKIPKRNEDQALDRLEQLTSTVERRIQWAGLVGNKPAEVKSSAWWWRCVGNDGGVYPTTQGVFGEMALTIKVRARIGGQ